jgi:SMI1/KNR4 family protein SUKH-1
MPFPVDIKYVHEAENKLGTKFPASFVTKMVKSNGGAVSTSIDSFELHPFMDSSDRKRLARTCNDIVRETTHARSWPDFPPTAVAVGANGGGDRLVLIPQSDRPDLLSHQVYWWDHETGRIELVADDFSDLAS